MSLSIDISEGNGCVVLSIHGDVDIDTAPQLREQLLVVARQSPRRVIVDLEAVGFLDSSGIGLLVGAMERLRSAGSDLALVCTNRNIVRTLEMTGLANVFRIFESVEAASDA